MGRILRRMKLPNLDLIEYKAENVLRNHDEFVERIKKAREDDPYRSVDLVLHTFPQMWGSTALGFDGIGGQAMTEAYTTVVHERVTNTFVIFFGEKPCYSLIDPTEEFFEDLKNLRIAGVNEARDRYVKEAGK